MKNKFLINKYLSLGILLLLAPAYSWAGDTLNLTDCYKAALKRSEVLATQQELVIQAEETYRRSAELRAYSSEESRQNRGRFSRHHEYQPRYGKSQQDALQSAQDTAKRILPPEYHIALTGSSQTFTESLKSLVWVLLLGIVVAYMVLASQFNSFTDPLSVLMALPFSISGALMALLITQRSINIYSVIGLILLMGIVKKNSILLVDFTNQVRERGEASVDKALLIACPIRLRPILMTSVATIAGAIPAALAFGPGAESRTPMAIAVIGGVIFSTVLTLYVVPCFYRVMSRFEGKHKHEKRLSDALEEKTGYVTR